MVRESYIGESEREGKRILDTCILGREREEEGENETANPSLSSQHGESPLHIAAGYGRLKIVQLLRSHGASTDVRDKVRGREREREREGKERSSCQCL